MNVKSIKSVSKSIVLIILLMSISKMVKVPFSYTQSNVLSLYLSDFAGFFVWLVLIYHTLVNRKSITKSEKVEIVYFIVFCVYCAILTMYRFLKGNVDLASLLIPRTLVMSIWMYFLIRSKILKKENMVISSNVFALVLSVFSVFLSLTTHRFSYVILQSTAIRTTILVIFYPVVLYNYLENNNVCKLFNSIVFYIATIALLFLGVASGARLNSVLVPLLLICAYILIRQKKKRDGKNTVIVSRKKRLPQTRIFGLCIIISLVLTVAMYPLSSSFRDGANRSMLYRPVLDSIINVLYIEDESIDIPENSTTNNIDNNGTVPVSTDSSDTITQPDDIVTDADQSMEDSYSTRIEVWKEAYKDILKNPFFGPGLKQYLITYSTGSSHMITPHNFVLEYILAIGLIGLLGFVLFFIVVIVRLLVDKCYKEKHQITGWICLLISLFTAFSIASFQPIFINATVMVIVCFSFGFFVTFIESHNVEIS